MNGMKRVGAYRTSIVCVSIVFLLLIRAQGLPRQKEQEQSAGNFTARQVMGLSEPLCRVVTGRSDSFKMAADSVHVGAHTFWNVLCMDNADQELFHLAWDADTGEISRVSMKGLHRSEVGPLLSAKETNAIGRDWLRTLPSGIPAASWRPVHPATCFQQQHWYLEYAAEGRRAILTLDAHTGALKFAKIERVL